MQRRINGDRQVSITKAERVEIVRRCRAAGWSYTDIERITGVTKVYRYIEREAS